MSNPDQPGIDLVEKIDEPPEGAQTQALIRLARAEDVHTQRSIIRFILWVTVGFIVSTVVMTLGVTIDQMWLFYTGMGMAVLCMAVILLQL
jgi:hypothetical protein